MIPPKEPKFSDFYQPIEQQKNGELIFVGASQRASLGLCSFSLHLNFFSSLVDGQQTKQDLLQPWGLLEGNSRHQKISEAAKVPKETAKQWLVRQAIWQIYLPAPRRIPRPKFDVPTPDAVHQADLLFLPNDKLPRGRKVYKYVLTVTDVASRYKEAEPLISKNSDEVSRAF